MRVRLAHQAFALGHRNGQDQGNNRGARSENRRHENVRIVRDASHSHGPLLGDSSRGGVEEGQCYFGPVVHHVHGGQGRDGLVRRRDRRSRKLDSNRDRRWGRCRPRYREPRGNQRPTGGRARIRRTVKEGIPQSGPARFAGPGAQTVAHAQIRQRQERASTNAARQYLATAKPEAVAARAKRPDCVFPPSRTHEPCS